MDVLIEALGFAGKGFVVFVTVVACAMVVTALVRGVRDRRVVPQIEVKLLSQELRDNADVLRAATMNRKAVKRLRKDRIAEFKRGPTHDKNVYVVDFKGDIVATAVSSLREEVTALLNVAGPGDEVIVRLESPGGAAHSYGLAASQLSRLRARSVALTVCVDKVAASGGYMMACVAPRIVAAPFSIIGSIGVAAPVPNVHRLLDKHGVDYENITAGEYKRTISFLGEITEKGRAKFQAQIQETHDLFKQWVAEHRPGIAIDEVATGEHWHGRRAHELGLVDEVGTSDDLLMAKAQEANVYHLEYRPPRSFRERIAGTLSLGAEKLILALLSRWNSEHPVR